MNTALILIDVQKIYTNPTSPLCVDGNDRVITYMKRLVDAASRTGDLIVDVRYLHCADGSDAGRMFDSAGEPGAIGFADGTPDAEFDPRLTVVPGALHIVKHRHSSFVGTDLDEVLRSRGIDTLIVTGFMTNYCCEATARHGHDLDYFIDFPMDATGCPDLSATATQTFANWSPPQRCKMASLGWKPLPTCLAPDPAETNP